MASKSRSIPIEAGLQIPLYTNTDIYRTPAVGEAVMTALLLELETGSSSANVRFHVYVGPT
ncbi:hypothetical protein KXW31_009277, partial [Aspergillus fumigatus]